MVGNGIQQEMLLKQGSIAAAEEEFLQVQPAALQTDASWKSYSLPLQVGEEIAKLLFYRWQGKQGRGEENSLDKNIFAIEFWGT